MTTLLNSLSISLTPPSLPSCPAPSLTPPSLSSYLYPSPSHSLSSLTMSLRSTFILPVFAWLYLMFLSLTSWNPTGSLYPSSPSLSLNFSFRSLLSSHSSFFLVCSSLTCLSSHSLSISFVLFPSICWLTHICLTWSLLPPKQEAVTKLFHLALVVSAAVKGSTIVPADRV